MYRKQYPISLSLAPGMVNLGVELPPPCDFLPCLHAPCPVAGIQVHTGIPFVHGPAICSQVHTPCTASVTAGIGRHGTIVVRNFKVQLQPRAFLDLCAPDSTRQHTARHLSVF